jgi:hypothetical protein
VNVLAPNARSTRLDKARVTNAILKVVVALTVGETRTVDWALKVGRTNTLCTAFGESAATSALAVVKATVARAARDANRVGWTLKVASGTGTASAPPAAATSLTIVGTQITPSSTLSLAIAGG